MFKATEGVYEFEGLYRAVQNSKEPENVSIYLNTKYKNNINSNIIDIHTEYASYTEKIYTLFSNVKHYIDIIIVV